MRIESVISVAATDSVGPTRLRLLTAGSVKLPVVVVAVADDAPTYYVMDVGTLQVALTNQLSATSISETLDLQARVPSAAVAKLEAKTAPAGSPVVEDGRLVGVIADDKPAHPEPTEADMSRGGESDSKESAPKRGLWRRLSGSQ